MDNIAIKEERCVDLVEPIDDDVKFWMGVREAVLLYLDVIERYKTRTCPRTSEIRKQWKADRRGV